jgi:hypothetical protein
LEDFEDNPVYSGRVRRVARMAYSLSSDIVWIDDVNEIRLFVGATSEFRVINESGADIWRQLVSGKSRREIVDALSHIYAASTHSERQILEKDTEEFISELLRGGFIYESDIATSPSG